MIRTKESIILSECISNGKVDTFSLFNNEYGNYFFATPDVHRYVDGIYNMYIRYSPKFKKLCLGIYNNNTIFIDNFIYIHTGNDPRVDSQSCLLCGSEMRIQKDGSILLYNSRIAFKEIVQPIIDKYNSDYFNKFKNYEQEYNIMKIDETLRICRR